LEAISKNQVRLRAIFQKFRKIHGYTPAFFQKRVWKFEIQVKKLAFLSKISKRRPVFGCIFRIWLGGLLDAFQPGG